MQVQAWSYIRVLGRNAERRGISSDKYVCQYIQTRMHTGNGREYGSSKTNLERKPKGSHRRGWYATWVSSPALLSFKMILSPDHKPFAEAALLIAREATSHVLASVPLYEGRRRLLRILLQWICFVVKRSYWSANNLPLFYFYFYFFK